VLGSGGGAHAARDLLPDFGHADFPLGGVVIDRDRGAGGEAKVVIEAPVDAPGQGPVFGTERPGWRGGDADAGSVVDELALVGEQRGVEEPGVRPALQDQECVDDLLGPAPWQATTGPWVPVWESVTAISSRRTWELHSWWLSWS